MVEHELPKLGVEGSSPFSRSVKSPGNSGAFVILAARFRLTTHRLSAASWPQNRNRKRGKLRVRDDAPPGLRPRIASRARPCLRRVHRSPATLRHARSPTQLRWLHHVRRRRELTVFGWGTLRRPASRSVGRSTRTCRTHAAATLAAIAHANQKRADGAVPPVRA